MGRRTSNELEGLSLDGLFGVVFRNGTHFGDVYSEGTQKDNWSGERGEGRAKVQDETLGDRSCEEPGVTAGGQARATEHRCFSQNHPSQSQPANGKLTSQVLVFPLLSTFQLPSIHHHVSHSRLPDAALAGLLQPRSCKSPLPPSRGWSEIIRSGSVKANSPTEGGSQRYDYPVLTITTL